MVLSSADLCLTLTELHDARLRSRVIAGLGLEVTHSKTLHEPSIVYSGRIYSSSIQRQMFATKTQRFTELKTFG